MFGRKAWTKRPQPGSEQPQEADLDRAKLIQILVENGITLAEEIAQVFQTLDEGPEHDWLAKAKAVRILAENGKETSDIIALLNALRKRPGQDLSSKIQALQILLDHGIQDCDDITRLLRALDDRAGKELSANVSAVQILVENGIEGSEDIERILEALGEYPAFDLSGKLTVLRLLVENGINDSEDIIRVLHALGKYPGQDLSSKIRAVQVLVEHGMDDSADIARVLNVLARSLSGLGLGIGPVTDPLPRRIGTLMTHRNPPPFCLLRTAVIRPIKRKMDASFRNYINNSTTVRSPTPTTKPPSTTSALSPTRTGPFVVSDWPRTTMRFTPSTPCLVSAGCAIVPTVGSETGNASTSRPSRLHWPTRVSGFPPATDTGVGVGVLPPRA